MMGAMNTQPAHPCLSHAPTPASHPEPLIHAQALFGQSRVVFIEYRGERYQLRQTRNGKLILTK
jgi:hemin uptake protein HemP